VFDIGFSELIVIGVVALIVIGPERLPTVARTVGHLLGRAQRFVHNVKADINREIEFDELRKLQTEMQEAARQVTAEVAASKQALENEVENTERDLRSADPVIGSPPPATEKPTSVHPTTG
jgi:sec-independent protein translocase protein TatB